MQTLPVYTEDDNFEGCFSSESFNDEIFCLCSVCSLSSLVGFQSSLISDNTSTLLNKICCPIDFSQSSNVVVLLVCVLLEHHSICNSAYSFQPD